MANNFFNLENLINSVAKSTNPYIGNILNNLWSSTSLSSEKYKSPFNDYGSLVASGSQPSYLKNNLADFTYFTIEEVRDRIKEFISGSFIPDTINELIKYLSDRFLKIETRINSNGNVVNYVVDTKTRKSIPAAQIHPTLSHSAILSRDLRQKIKPLLGNTSPSDAFSSWQGMSFVFENSENNVGYTVSHNNQGYIGKVYAYATSDIEMNKKIIKQAQIKGISLIIPEYYEGSAKLGKLVSGLPILIKTQSLKAEIINKSLSHSLLTESWGIGLKQSYVNMFNDAKKSGIVDKVDDNIVDFVSVKNKKQKAKDLEEFKRKFLKKEETNDFVYGDTEEDIGFAGLSGNEKTRNKERSFAIIREKLPNGLYQSIVWDTDYNEEAPLNPNCLPFGQYKWQNEKGEQLGNAVVSLKGIAFEEIDYSVKKQRKNELSNKMKV